jgi:hypothetical protein
METGKVAAILAERPAPNSLLRREQPLAYDGGQDSHQGKPMARFKKKTLTGLARTCG